MAKKGLPTIAWIAIGCGGLVVIAGLVLALGLGFAVKKGKDMIQDIEDDPVAVLAKVTAAANPEIELVEADKETQVVTFRNVADGELIKINYKDLQEGKISFESGDQKVEIDGTATGADGESGSLSITTNEGTTTYQAGGDTGNMPDWIELYPQARVTGSAMASGTDGTTGYVTQATDASVDQAVDHYKTWFDRQGYEIKSQQRIESNGETMVVFQAEDAGSSRTVNVTVSSQDGVTQIGMQYNQGG